MEFKNCEAHMEGGCTCRHVRYRLTGTPLIVHACHCTWCQRETGSIYALNALYEADRVHHLGGEPELINTPSASGRGHRIARCPACKVAIWSNYPQAGPASVSSASEQWMSRAAARRRVWSAAGSCANAYDPDDSTTSGVYVPPAAPYPPTVVNPGGQSYEVIVILLVVASDQSATLAVSIRPDPSD